MAVKRVERPPGFLSKRFRGKDDLEEDSKNTGSKKPRRPSWDLDNMPLEMMEDRHWRIFRENHDIILRNGIANATNPIRDWTDLKAQLPSQVLANIAKAGFKKPTPIQM